MALSLLSKQTLLARLFPLLMVQLLLLIMLSEDIVR